MTNEQLIKEFERWILAGKPYVWVQQDSDSWYISPTTCWNSSDVTYIIDDEHATLRKLQIDEPDTKFQVYHTSTMKWETVEPVWEPGRKYRIKRTEWYEDPAMVDKPIWVKDDDSMCWGIDIFLKYTRGVRYPFECRGSNWKEAKPIKPEDLYQGGKDD